MLRLILCFWCALLAAPVMAHGADPGAPTDAAPTPDLDTPEGALAYLASISRPIPVKEADRMETLFRAAMQADPRDMRWPAGIAMLTRYKGGIADAEDLARRAVETEPTAANSWFALAMVLANGSSDPNADDRPERSKAAIGAIERALNCDPMHPGALGMAIEYYTNVPPSAGGDRARAIELAERLMTIESVRCRGAELRARICLGSKDWAGVDEWFAKGIEWAPDPATTRELHRQHALLYLSFAKDYPRAIAIATPFADPQIPDGYRFSFIVGQAAYRLNDCDLAIRHYQLVVDNGEPPSVVLMELADCLEKRGDLAGAVRTLEFFATRFRGHPKEEEVLISLNRLRRALGQQGEAQTPPSPSAPSPAALGGNSQGE